jgi:hypothetical protein
MSGSSGFAAGDYHMLEANMPAPWAAHAQVRILGRLHGQQTVNVLNLATNTVVNDDLTGIALLQQLGQDIRDCVEQTLALAVTSDWKFEMVDVRKTGPTVGDTIEIAPTDQIEGALAPTSVSFAATLVRILTGGGGRSGRGRIFLPPPGEPQITQSAMDANTNALVVAFCACLIGKFIQNATTPWRLGVLSRKKVNNVLPPIDERFREAVNLTVVSQMAKIGSRKVGHGS